MEIDRSKHATWVLLFIEAAPLVAFSYSGRLGLEIPQRFYVGAGFAMLCTGFLLTRGWRFNPLLIAANVWLCLEALALGSGIASLVQLSAVLEESAFFAMMLIIGFAFLLLSPQGLFARSGEDDQRVRQGSILLLALIAASLIWSLTWRGNEMVAAVLPATIVFLVQQLWPVRRKV